MLAQVLEVDSAPPAVEEHAVITIEGVAHYVRRCGGQWGVVPAMVLMPMTAEETEQYGRDLREASRLATHLNDVERRQTEHPGNAAVSDEVRELMASFGWTPTEAARRFGMRPSALSARLTCRAPWTIADLGRIVAGVDPVDPVDMVLRLYAIGTVGIVGDPQEWVLDAA
jgi:hypothetical protein